MAEYIEREALEVALNHRLNFLMAEYGEYDNYTGGFDEAVTRVEDFPAADVAPVRHGEWVVCGDGKHVPWMCSHCGKTTAHEYKMMYGNYCPNCGCRMDGGDDE